MKSSILLTLGGIFALSLVGRSVAVAGASPELKLDEQPATITEAVDEGAEPACVSEEMLEVLKDRRAEIDKRELELKERERTLEVVEKRLNERMTALDQTNAQLKTKLEMLQKNADEDLIHLADMYETMKPKQASIIFNQMDPVFAASFLRLMDSNNAGLIMANMESKKAYTISVIMANRNADMRK
jgi:flagellar motility protein MotE (MotC chaperone)